MDVFNPFSWISFGVAMLVLVTALLVVLPIYYILRYRRSKQRWREIREHFGFEEPSSYRLTGSWQGHNVTIEYNPGGRHQRASVTLGLEAHFDHIPTATLRRERWWDRLGKRAALNRELQADRDRFDRRFYVQTDDERFRTLLRRQEFRAWVDELVDSRHAEVRVNTGFDGGIEWHSTVHFGFWNRFRPEYLENLFRALVRGRELLDRSDEAMTPASPTGATGDGSEPSALLRYGGYGAPIVGVFGGFVLFFAGTYYPTFTHRLQWLGLKLAAGAFLLYLPVAYLVCRGRSSGHKEFGGLVFCALFGFPLLFVGGLKTANGMLDGGQPIWQQGTVSRLHADDGEYYANVRTRHGDVRGEPEIEVSYETYQRLRRRPDVHLKVSPGYLSEPWVDDLSLP